jgi:quercetin dioxygenase-like cupin family protein
MQSIHIVNEGTYGVLDVFGPTLEFFILPEKADGTYCVMTGTIPPGVSVPLHSHPDIEGFFLVSGAVQIMSQRDGKFEWLDVRPGEFVYVPSNAKHAWRNTASEPAVQLITTTSTLGRFFQEIGRPVTLGRPLLPPTPNDLRRIMRVVAKYNYWIRSPTEHAAIGIALSSRGVSHDKSKKAQRAKMYSQ